LSGSTCGAEICVMRIQLYIDEDAMAGILVKGLRARGIDIATVLEEEMTGRGDDEQLEYASERKRALYTFNVGDFCLSQSPVLIPGAQPLQKTAPVHVSLPYPQI